MALDLISSQLPEIDGCTLFTAVRAILADQGVPALVEHQIRDRTGKPVDLSELFPSGDSQDSVDAATGTVKVRVKEAVSDSPDSTVNPLWELPATVQTMIDDRCSACHNEEDKKGEDVWIGDIWPTSDEIDRFYESQPALFKQV